MSRRDALARGDTSNKHHTGWNHWPDGREHSIRICMKKLYQTQPGPLPRPSETRPVIFCQPALKVSVPEPQQETINKHMDKLASECANAKQLQDLPMLFEAFPWGLQGQIAAAGTSIWLSEGIESCRESWACDCELGPDFVDGFEGSVAELLGQFSGTAAEAPPPPTRRRIRGKQPPVCRASHALLSPEQAERSCIEGRASGMSPYAAATPSSAAAAANGLSRAEKVQVLIRAIRSAAELQ